MMVYKVIKPAGEERKVSFDAEKLWEDITVACIFICFEYELQTSSLINKMVI